MSKDSVLGLKINFTPLNDFQVLAHIKVDGDELAICTVAAQMKYVVTMMEDMR